MQTTPYEVRRLAEDDAERFLTLRLQGLKEAPSAFGSTYEEDAARGIDFIRMLCRKSQEQDSHAIFGAFQQSELVGVVGIMQGEKIKNRHRATLWGMYVTPAARGVGVGRLLCQALIEHARSNLVEVEAIDLMVESANEPAKKLYAAMGFKWWGTQPRALKFGGQYFDEDCMALVLV